jgi:hypothetical protein
VSRRYLNKSNTERPEGGLVAYKFHTNILAVNRTIRSETQELLYKRNIFVVVSYQWPELNEPLGGLS